MKYLYLFCGLLFGVFIGFFLEAKSDKLTSAIQIQALKDTMEKCQGIKQSFEEEGDSIRRNLSYIKSKQTECEQERDYLQRVCINRNVKSR